MFHQTAQKLSAFTDHVEFERMAADVLSYLEYPGIDPQSPDLADGGKDALYYSYDGQNCTWFAFSLRKDWKVKFKADLKSAIESGNDIRRFVFCTNRCIPALERDKLKTEVFQANKLEVEFFDGERLRVSLDTVCKDVRQTYLGIIDNTTVRRQLRYVLLDPENEVPAIQAVRAEAVFLSSSAARGVFTLLKDADLSSVCETPEEMRCLSELLDSYFVFRRTASGLESFTVDYVGEHMPSNHFVGYWQVIAGYCIRVVLGWGEEDAMRWSKLQGISHNGRDCVRIASDIQQDEKFRSIISDTGVRASHCNERVAAVRALESLVARGEEY
jgi:hypothetical protein